MLELETSGYLQTVAVYYLVFQNFRLSTSSMIHASSVTPSPMKADIELLGQTNQAMEPNQLVCLAKIQTKQQAVCSMNWVGGSLDLHIRLHELYSVHPRPYSCTLFTTSNPCSNLMIYESVIQAMTNC